MPEHGARIGRHVVRADEDILAPCRPIGRRWDDDYNLPKRTHALAAACKAAAISG